MREHAIEHTQRFHLQRRWMAVRQPRPRLDLPMAHWRRASHPDTRTAVELIGPRSEVFEHFGAGRTLEFAKRARSRLAAFADGCKQVLAIWRRLVALVTGVGAVESGLMPDMRDQVSEDFKKKSV